MPMGENLECFFFFSFLFYTHVAIFLSHPRPLEEGQCSEIFQDSGKMFKILMAVYNNYTENSHARQGI